MDCIGNSFEQETQIAFPDSNCGLWSILRTMLNGYLKCASNMGAHYIEYIWVDIFLLLYKQELDEYEEERDRIITGCRHGLE